MELFHLIRFLVWLDGRLLRSLRYWAPDFQEVLHSPAEFFQFREIEIGPWTGYATTCFIPTLLTIPGLVAGFKIGSWGLITGSILFWLLFTGGLLYAFRGGQCLLQAKGVEFRYHGVTAFCPWDLFHAEGRPIYYSEKQQLDLPVAPAAMADVEVRKHGRVVAQGADARARHFQARPTGEIRLKLVYGIKPEELGWFLLELGRKLGRPRERAVPEAAPLAPQPVEGTADGWIRVSLTRLRFPPFCCDCGQSTNSWQDFRGYRSMPADDSLRLAAPVCGDCQRVNRSRYRRTLVKTALLVLMGVTVFVGLLGLILDLCNPAPKLQGMTLPMTVIGFSVGVGLSWLIAGRRAHSVSAPVHLSDYRPGTGTIRIRFRNPKYAVVFLAVMSGELTS